VISNPGGFAGLFALGKYREPVLVSCTDGVGPSSSSRRSLGRHDTVGIDLVAMSVNDLIVQGAEPLFFLDYIAMGRVEPGRVKALIAGVIEGCRLSGCALLGGETAEMPGIYAGEDYDLAGFAVGVVERDAVIDGARVEAGDALVGIASSGVHSKRVLARAQGLRRGRAHPLDARAPPRSADGRSAKLCSSHAHLRGPRWRALLARFRPREEAPRARAHHRRGDPRQPPARPAARNRRARCGLAAGPSAGPRAPPRARQDRTTRDVRRLQHGRRLIAVVPAVLAQATVRVPGGRRGRRHS